MGRTGYALAVTMLALALQGCIMPGETPGKGNRLLDAPLYTLDGQRTSVLQMARGKVAVFKFGASWCHWCTKQIPHLNEVAKRYPKDKVVVFDIDVQETAKVAQAYAEKEGIAYPMLLDPRGTAATLYSLSGIPVVIVADADGIVLYRGNYTAFEELDRVIAPAVKRLGRGGG